MPFYLIFANFFCVNFCFINPKKPSTLLSKTRKKTKSHHPQQQKKNPDDIVKALFLAKRTNLFINQVFGLINIISCYTF